MDGAQRARHIVRAHEGAIAVDSVLGSGAHFTIWLPRDRREAQRA